MESTLLNSLGSEVQPVWKHAIETKQNASSVLNEKDNETARMTLPPAIPFVEISRSLVTFVIPILFSFGTVGNIMTIAVLVRRGVKQNTTTFYLFVLSVSDLLCLYVGMPVFYVNELSEVNFRDFSEAVCRVHTFLTYCFTHLVAWTIVAMQVDRTIWVAMPFKAKQLCTIRNASVIMVAIVVLLILFNNHFLWTLEVRLVQDQRMKCIEMHEYEVFANYVVGLMDVGIFSLLPSTIMFVCNTVIMLKLKQFARNRSRLLSRQPSVHSHSNVSTVSSTTEQQRSGSFSQSSSSKERSLTIMLQTVSTFFIVTTLPVCATNLAYSFAFSSNSDADPYSMAAMIFYGLQTIGCLLTYLNISVQFILYFLSCKNFRKDVREMLAGCLNRCGAVRLAARTLSATSNSATRSMALTETSKYSDNADTLSPPSLLPARAKILVQRPPVSKSILKRHSDKSKSPTSSLARATISVDV